MLMKMLNYNIEDLQWDKKQYKTITNNILL